MADKHTPGPWRTGREDMQSYDGATGEPFASVYCDDERAEMHLGEKLPYDIARTFGDECKANARLIAAAPELLESLKEFVGLANFDADTVPKTTEEWDAMVAKAEAVIAKAEGE